MWRIFIGVFLILHGLVHVGAASAPAPGEEDEGAFRFFLGEDRSWLLRSIGVGDSTAWWIAVGLVAAATIGFVIAGVAIFAGISLWRDIAIMSAAPSILLIVTFWNRYLPIGLALNVAILVLLLASIWPNEDLAGS